MKKTTAKLYKKKRSIWSGDSENAFFSSEIFDKHRTLLQPEYEYSSRSSKNAYYILGVDVGRFGCTTEVMIIKVTPQVQGASLKTLVNLYSFEEEHFGMQAIHIKQLFYKYKARTVVIDANGLGSGLVDFMVIGNEDPETGEYYRPFGIEDANFEGWYDQYKSFKTDDMEKDAMYLIKATAPLNTEAHSNCQSQISSGKVKFLIDERDAKIKLISTKVGQEMNADQRAERLVPFTLTTILKEQMMNLVAENEGINILLKQNNRGIKKDKFSAFEYGLYYIKQQEDKKKKKKSFGISDMMFFS